MTLEDPSGGFHAQLSDLLLSEETVSGLLGMLVEIATSTIPGLDGASVSLTVGQGRRLETTSASSQTVRAVDEAQYQDRQGPCVEAIQTGQEVTITLPTDRWPTFSDRAQQAGMRSVLSLPLQVRDRTTGALNLYSRGERPLAGREAAAGRVLARQAVCGLTTSPSAGRSCPTTSRGFSPATAG